MGIQYRIVKRANNMARKKDEQYIMQAVHTGIVDQEQLAFEVSNQCTVHPADVEAVISALSLQMKFHLGEGKVVVLDKLGRFKLGFQGTAQPDPSLLRKKDIKKFYINFQPALRIKKWLKGGVTVFKEPKKKK
jgi:predicted histone-like DNA-binding protein